MRIAWSALSTRWFRAMTVGSWRSAGVRTSAAFSAASASIGGWRIARTAKLASCDRWSLRKITNEDAAGTASGRDAGSAEAAGAIAARSRASATIARPRTTCPTLRGVPVPGGDFLPPPYRFASMLAANPDEDVARRDGVPFPHADLADDAGPRRGDLVLHLHRLEDDEGLAAPHALADLCKHLHDPAGHGRAHVDGRRLAAAKGLVGAPRH